MQYRKAGKYAQACICNSARAMAHGNFPFFILRNPPPSSNYIISILFLFQSCLLKECLLDPGRNKTKVFFYRPDIFAILST
jgi:hypothetical protein